MLTALFLLVIILGLLFSKSKLVRLLQYIIIYIVFVFNSWNQDNIYYERIYSGYYGASYEPGFYLLCQSCYNNGIDFETFRMVYVSVAVILLYIALNTLFKSATNRAYSLIMLYPLLPFVELLRNFMAIAIVSCGISWYFLLDRDGIREKIILTFIIIIGATFHYNVLFFLILLFPTNNKPDRGTYSQIVLIAIGSIIICNMPIFLDIFSLIISSEKVLVWFSSSHRIGLGIIVVLMFHISSFFIYNLIYKKYYYKDNRNINAISKKIYSLNVYSFFLFGLYTFNMEFFSRIYIVILLLNCFCISTIAKRIKSIDILICQWFHVLYHGFMFMYFCQPFNEEGIMSFILHNNKLFQ